jgi:uncharacterized protein YjbI with pentapeptide repeats
MQQQKCRYHDVCGLNGIGTTDLCVLHTDSSTKKKEAFDEALAAHRQKNGDHFLAFVFPQDVDFSNVSFDCGADFSDVIFYGVPNFSGADFHQKASFVGVQFLGGVNFGGAKFFAFGNFAGAGFERVANFDKAEFMNGANFSPYDKQRGMFFVAPFSVLTSFKWATFVGPVDFSGRSFQGPAIFSESTFADSANFARTRFFQDTEFPNSTLNTDFSSTRFGTEADFSGSEFNVEVAFQGAKFGQANFSNTTFGREADFADAEFEGEADFEKSAFGKLANFMSAEFSQEANFSTSMFAEEANFVNAIFAGRAVFALAGFGDVAHFGHAKFINLKTVKDADNDSPINNFKISFWHTNFNKLADFTCAEFKQGANFSRVKFKEGADFTGALFDEKANFLGSIFLGRTSFVSGQDEGQASQIFPGVEIDFSGVIIDPLNALTIRDADLQKCKFKGTDLRKAEITNATWPKIPVRSFGITISSRNGVYDEVLLPKGEFRLLSFLRSFSLFSAYQRPPETANQASSSSWPYVEQLYRQLKQNYEGRRAYQQASDFHYGEREMQRQNPDTEPSLRRLLWLYGLISAYGERWLRPLMWAAVLLIICVPAYLWSGLWSNESKSLLDWRNWGGAVRYSFQTMTLLKPADLVAVGCLSKWMHALQSLLGPVLLGLFALALRQRLKR